MPWFSSKGQIAQVVLAAIACVIAGKKAWPDMNMDKYFSAGSVLFYLLVLTLLVAIWIAVRALTRPTTDPEIDESTRERLPSTKLNESGLAETRLQAEAELRTMNQEYSRLDKYRAK